MQATGLRDKEHGFAAYAATAVRITHARTVLDVGCGPHSEDEPYAPAVLAALPKDGLYVAVDMDSDAIENHRALVENDPRMEYHVALFDRFAHERRGWKADLLISRCFMCLSFSSGPSHEQRVASAMNFGKYVLAHDTISPPPGLRHRDWLNKFGDIIWDFEKPLTSGAGRARVFLVRAR